MLVTYDCTVNTFDVGLFQIGQILKIRPWGRSGGGGSCFHHRNKASQKRFLFAAFKGCSQIPYLGKSSKQVDIIVPRDEWSSQ